MHGVLFIGHSKVPAGSAVRDVSETLALSCVVDPRHGVVMEVSCTLVTQSAVRILEDVIVGQVLSDGVEPTSLELRTRYHGAALSAIEAALQDVHNQWRRWQESEADGPTD